jgi:hypothetical protein
MNHRHHLYCQGLQNLACTMPLMALVLWSIGAAQKLQLLEVFTGFVGVRRQDLAAQ